MIKIFIFVYVLAFIILFCLFSVSKLADEESRKLYNDLKKRNKK